MPATAPLMPHIDFAYDELPNLHDILEELRAHGPVVSVKNHGAPTWLILDHAELNRAFTDEVHFDPSGGYLAMTEIPMGRNLLALTGEEHRVTRAMVAPSFLPARTRSYVENLIEPVAHELLDRIEGQREVEFVESFTRLFPFSVITRLLSIPVSDESLLLQWAVKLIDYPRDPQGSMEAKAGFDAYMEAIIEERCRQPGDDFVSMLIAPNFKGKSSTASVSCSSSAYFSLLGRTPPTKPEGACSPASCQAGLLVQLTS